jgi:hypothetical protein
MEIFSHHVCHFLRTSIWSFQAQICLPLRLWQLDNILGKQCYAGTYNKSCFRR